MEERRKEKSKKEREKRTKVKPWSHSHDGLSMAWERDCLWYINYRLTDSVEELVSSLS